MPTYIDIHDLPGVKAEDVVGAHEADVRVLFDPAARRTRATPGPLR